MKGKTPINELSDDIINIYRTKNFIVYQRVYVCYGDSGNILISDDIYRLRTPARDTAYEENFGYETSFNKRKRMRVAAYTRTYEN